MSPRPGTLITELTCQKDFLDLLRGDGCYVRVVLTGGLVNPGFPDMFLCNKTGRQFWVENKMWRLKGDPQTPADLVALLKGPQRNFIIGEVWRRGGLLFILAFTYKGEAWVTEGKGVYRNTLEGWAHYFANL